VATGIIEARRAWTVSMIVGVVDALQIDRRDAEGAVAELALDDDQRHALAGHLHGVRVPEAGVEQSVGGPGIGCLSAPEGRQ
jgi:hypothetical protein